jgi:hypothetical protein
VQTKSAPTRKAHATSAGVTSLPEAMTFTRSRSPCSRSRSMTKDMGAAPVPPPHHPL